MPRLLINANGREAQTLELRPGVNRIGRSTANHFQITDPSVSSVHCELIMVGGNIYVRDLGSTNGTFIDGEPIKEAMIQVGQKLQVAGVEMLLEDTPAPAEIPAVSIPPLTFPQPPPALSAATLPDGSLACLNHPQVHAQFKCSQCGQSFCDACVRIVRRVGGTSLILCPLCRAQCDPISLPTAGAQKKSFIGRITQTLRLPFLRR